MKPYILLAFAMALPGRLFAGDSAFSRLIEEAGQDLLSIHIPPVMDPTPVSGDGVPQYVPPDSDAPGFSWEEVKRRAPGNYIVTGNEGARLRTDISGSEDDEGSYMLEPDTMYKLQTEPGFEGDMIKVELRSPSDGRSLKSGYLKYKSIKDSSYGGLNDLPPTVKAFLDTLAYAEGTHGAYNLKFTHKPFAGYADHPRHVICGRRYCSTAAGRYQFLARTWDSIARKLNLKDFSPPNQDKAAMELIRRAGAYKAVLNSSNKAQFVSAVRKVRNIWASLPGNHYRQPSKSISRLWSVHKKALAKYR